MYYYYGLIEELPSGTAPPKKIVGSFGAWEKKRRIPVELLREILREQGSPWAKELGDKYEEAETRLASVKSSKHRRVLGEVLDGVSERVVKPVDWTPVVRSMDAALEAARTSLAIRHAEAAASAIRSLRRYEREQERELDDENVILMWWNVG